MYILDYYIAFIGIIFFWINLFVIVDTFEIARAEIAILWPRPVMIHTARPRNGLNHVNRLPDLGPVGQYFF